MVDGRLRTTESVPVRGAEFVLTLSPPIMVWCAPHPVASMSPHRIVKAMSLKNGANIMKPSVMEIDVGGHVYRCRGTCLHLHGVNVQGQLVLRKQFGRDALIEWLGATKNRV